MEKRPIDVENDNLDQDLISNYEKPVIQDTKENVFQKGEERFNIISKTISEAKDKTFGLFKRAGSRIGRSFKSVFVGILSSPEILEMGAEKFEEMAVKGSDLIEGKVKSGVNYVGDKINQGLDTYTSFVENIADRGYDWSKRRVEKTSELINGSIELGKDVSFYVKNKSTETLKGIKDGISNRYNSIVEFGVEAINGAKESVRAQKEKFNKWRNKIRMERLAKELERNIASVSLAAESNRLEIESRTKNLQMLNEKLQRLLETKNNLFNQPQIISN